MKEAIILAGGLSLRLKPHTWTDKPLLKFGDKTLLEMQIDWLFKKGFEHVVIATTPSISDKINLNHEYLDKMSLSLEYNKLGTGGAIFRAMDWISSKKVYIMNVDDLLLNFNPMLLFQEHKKGGIVCLHKPKIGYGLARLRNGMIIRFQEKPTIKYWVSCGHYVFDRKTIADYFPIKGDFEPNVLPILAKERLLYGYKYHGEWITVNTYKENLEALEKLKYIKWTRRGVEGKRNV